MPVSRLPALVFAVFALLLSPVFASDLPKNTKLEVRLDQSLSSDSAIPGEKFSATLDKAVSLGSNEILPKGSKVEGVVQFARSTMNYQQAGELDLKLVSVNMKGKAYSLVTNTVMVAGRDQPVDPRTGRVDDTGARRADATQAAIDAMGIGRPGMAATVPGTPVAVGTGRMRNGMQVILPPRSKLQFLVTEATAI